MKTILIPVDFSATSSNALDYTLGLIKDIDVGRIILLKTFYKSFYEQILPSADFVQISEEEIQNEKSRIDAQLNELTQQLKQECRPSVEVQIATSNMPLLRSVVDLIDEERPDLLILGSDGPDASEESYIGQLIIPITKASAVPVLIIPAHTKFKSISNTLIPCDFTKISRLAVIQSLNSPLQWLHPDFVILNIDPKQKYLSHEQENLDSLKPLLAGYDYKIYYAADRDTVTGILNFADEHEVQMITALPGKYSFFSTFTHTSTTEALTLNAKHPVLILK
jgi:nucleotide-binding universal stress UspA family protein